MCAEQCARLAPGGRSGAKPWSAPQPQPQQEEAKEAAEAANDVEGGGHSPSVATGAEVDAPQASPEARPQILTKPRVLGKPQELASPPAGRPTPAPRKASESTALTPPTPRPRSSLQPENLVEQGGSSGLVNGEQGSSSGQEPAVECLVFACTCALRVFMGPRSVCVSLVWGLTLFLRWLVHATDSAEASLLGCVLHAGVAAQTKQKRSSPRLRVLCASVSGYVTTAHGVCLGPDCLWDCVSWQSD